MWTIYLARLNEKSSDPAFAEVWTVKLAWNGRDFNPKTDTSNPDAQLNLVAYGLKSSSELRLHPEVNFALGGRLSVNTLDIVIEIGRWNGEQFVRPDGYAARDPSGDIRFLVREAGATVTGTATLYAPSLMTPARLGT